MRRLLTVAALAAIPLLVPSGAAAAKKVPCKVPAFPTAAGAFDTLSAKIVSCKTAQSIAVYKTVWGVYFTYHQSTA